MKTSTAAAVAGAVALTATGAVSALFLTLGATRTPEATGMEPIVVTEFVDHERRARSTDNRLDSAWFGKGAQIKQRALEQTSLLVA